MIGAIRAAGLPDGSVVSDSHTTYVKDHPSPTAPWRGTRGSHHGDWEVDKALTDGAEVLRLGDRSGETVAGARWGNLTAPERAALDAWTRGSADTNGMLYAVRHALAVERSAVQRGAAEQDALERSAARPTLAPDARERLAEQLYLAERADGREWSLSPHVDREPYLRRADAILAVMTDQEG